jgi:hypothetical protein
MSVDNAQCKARGDGGVDGVAAFLKGLDSRARGQLVNCRDHALFKLLSLD